LALAFFLLVALQLVPLPPEIWSALPGRKVLVEGFEALNACLPELPLSMAPEETILALPRFLTPLAGVAVAAKTPGRTLTTYLLRTLVIIAAASVMLGLAQVFSGRDSPFYFYAFTNWGQPVGFMANANHQASFLLRILPFAAVLFTRLGVRS